MEGFEVNTIEDTLGDGDIYVTTTGNCDIITLEHMAKMKDQAIVCNIGHFDNEIQVDRLEQGQGRDAAEHQAASRPLHLPRRQQHLHARRRPPGEPRLRHRPSELRHVATRSPTRSSRSSTSGRTRTNTKPAVYRLPKKLDEEVARLHLEKIGVKLTKLTKAQAEYLGVPVEGPYKPEHYRY